MRDLHRPFWTATDGRRSGLIQVLERSQRRMTLFDFKNDIIASTVKRGQDWFSYEPSFPGNIYLLRHFSLVLVSTPPPFLRLGEEYKSLGKKGFSKVFSYISRFSLKSYLLTTIKEIIINGNGQPVRVRVWVRGRAQQLSAIKTLPSPVRNDIEIHVLTTVYFHRP